MVRKTDAKNKKLLMFIAVKISWSVQSYWCLRNFSAFFSFVVLCRVLQWKNARNSTNDKQFVIGYLVHWSSQWSETIIRDSKKLLFDVVTALYYEKFIITRDVGRQFADFDRRV